MSSGNTVVGVRAGRAMQASELEPMVRKQGRPVSGVSGRRQVWDITASASMPLSSAHTHVAFSLPQLPKACLLQRKQGSLGSYGFFEFLSFYLLV